MHLKILFFTSFAAMLCLTLGAPFGVEHTKPLSRRLATRNANANLQDAYTRLAPLAARLRRRDIEQLIARTRSRSSSKSGASGTSASSISSIRSRNYKKCQEPEHSLERRTNDEPAQKKFQSAPAHDLQAEIGEGSNGKVYSSTDPAHPDSLVKIIDGTSTAKVKTEVTALHKVGQLREWGVFGGKTYIVMQHIPGQHMLDHPLVKATKKDKSPEGKKKLEELFGHIRKLLAVEVKRAMKDHQVMHNDLHGGNVLLQGTTLTDLQVHLIDWGKVRFIGPDCQVEEAEIDETLNDKIASADFYPAVQF